jgi:hypothetical protein
VAKGDKSATLREKDNGRDRFSLSFIMHNAKTHEIDWKENRHVPYTHAAWIHKHNKRMDAALRNDLIQRYQKFRRVPCFLHNLTTHAMHVLSQPA